MGTLQFDTLLRKLWEEIEKHIASEAGINMKNDKNELIVKINDVLEDAEKRISYSFMQLDLNEYAKGHHVDAIMELTISLSNKAYDYVIKPSIGLDHTNLLEIYLKMMDKFMVNIRRKFSHLQYAKLYPPHHYIKFVIDKQFANISFILKVLDRENVGKDIIHTMKEYFSNPVPLGQASISPHDGFRSLEYYEELVESLSDLCKKTSGNEFMEIFYYELISKNFNRLQFVRALIKLITIEKTVDSLSAQINKLHSVKKELGKIPVSPGIAYMPTDLGLKEILAQALVEEIDYLNMRKERLLEQSTNNQGPTFSTNMNVFQLLLMFNVLLNNSLLNRIGKLSLPLFIHKNFVRANGEQFSLQSLKKKNSQIDIKTTRSLIEILTKMIDYLRRNYL